MKMKKLLYTVLLLCTCQLFSQGIFRKDPIVNLENWNKQRVFWGYYLGFNSYDFKFNYNGLTDKDILVKSTTSFNVGLVGDLRLQEYINLRFEPGLYYTQRNLTFPGFVKEKDFLREVKSTYLHFPLLLKYSALRTGNIRPFLVGGASATLNMASNSKSKDDNLQNRFRMKPWTRNYEIGLGIDIYTEYFVFSPSVRGVFGLDNEIIYDNDPNSPWTSDIASMKTRAVFVNFTFH